MQNKTTILAIMGKSGAGKDTIANQLSSAYSDFHRIITCTTRPPRENEIDGVNYHFLTLNAFEQKILKNEMLEYTKFRGWFYGTDKTALEQNAINIGVYNPAGYLHLHESLFKNQDVRVIGIYLQASGKNRLFRSLRREERPDVKEICRRFLADEEDFDFLDRDEHPEVIRLANNEKGDQSRVLNFLEDLLDKYR